MQASKLSSKGQVTVPRKVREILKARPGDILVYDIAGSVVKLRRMSPFDEAFHATLSSTLSEWESREDEDAFRDL